MSRRAFAAIAIAVAAALATACSESLVGPPPSQDRAALFDEVWNEFDLHYSYFAMKGIDWTAIGDRYRSQALAARNDTAFAAVLGHMLAELHDVHVSITPFGAGSTIRYVAPFDTIASGMNETVVFGHYASAYFTTSGGHIRAGQTAPGVGYIRIASFAGGDWAGEMDEALQRLGDVSSMIVDVRNNGGGKKGLGTQIAGRFADRERTFGYVRLRNGPKHTDFTDDIADVVRPEGARHFAGHVVVLTNRRCYSSAEDFVLAMRALPTATIVGDTTGGASGGPLVREMANGWTYQLSQWVAYTQDHRAFEGIGLAPDVAIKANLEAMRASKDVVLERGIAVAQQ